MLIQNLYWIVVEDSSEKNLHVEEILMRSKLSYFYLFTLTTSNASSNIYLFVK